MRLTGLSRGFFAALCCATLFACSRPEPASDKTAGTQPKKFVQDFYAWYVPFADSARLQTLMHERMRVALASTLLDSLQQDFEAQERDTSGSIVGLDFDPFLAAQDPCERYEVTSVTLKDESFWAEIHGVGGCRVHSDADLVAEVKSKNGGWEFVNFHYPDPRGGDLLSILGKLRSARASF